ncbi:uncharacterized protein UV8b_02004 [Ustilaginoidea virens]|uniref:Vacuolar membrane protein n=1 Tax=Ustilaginoidea virens TaxID=1159556 RepID=A0A8E5MEW7_USTVR|nr:uncharacterized protein UV8b_02004 [Ustilaginoidea virens]QUC17763.1 hypothetical protein UV8b_02004 [Ustilaginoidea virens]
MQPLLDRRDAQHADFAAVVGVDAPSAVATVLSSAVSAAVVAVAAAATGAPTTAPSSVPDPDPPRRHGSEGECQLLGSFALLVQAALGALALLSLVFKRCRERPQRPLKIWFFDVSKQVFGSVLVHIANIFMSMLTSGRFMPMLTSGRFSIKLEPGAAQARAEDPYVPNPCSLYLLNLGIDTTLGIPILIILLKIITGLVALTPLGKPVESIQSGHYGDPPNAWWWLKQSLLYFCGLFGMKLCVLIVFLLMPWISQIGDWALSWTEGNEELQIAFVMMIFPLIMNALQYYIIDSFIKQKQAGGGHERLASDDADQAPLRGPYRSRAPRASRARSVDGHADDSDSDSDSDADFDFDSHARPLRSKRSRSSVDDEYDPAYHGDAHAHPVVGSGSGSSRSRVDGLPIGRELYPKE